MKTRKTHKTTIELIHPAGERETIVVRVPFDEVLVRLSQSLTCLSVELPDEVAVYATIIRRKIVIRAIGGEPGESALLEFCNALEPFHGRFA